MKPLFSALFLFFFSLQINAQPVVSSFSPQSASAGTTVTILGSNFNPLSNYNLVSFGNIRAIVNTATTNSIQVTVPAGATNLPVSVTDSGTFLTGYSSANFLPVFNGGADGQSTIAQSAVINTTSGSNTIFIKSADLDGDGKPDLIASYATANIGLFRNSSTPGNLDPSSFSTGIGIPSGFRCTIVAIADMNGDGKPDLIAYNQDVQELNIWQNQSVPGTIDFIKVVNLASTGTTICVGDIDGDGKPDLLQMDDQQPGTLKLIKNNSAGGILDNTSFDAPVSFAGLSGVEFMAVQDLDGDGKPEVVTCNRTNNSVSVFLNTSVPGIIDNGSLAARVDYPAGTGPFNIAITDIDGDGKADLIVSNADTNTVSVIKNLTTPGNIGPSSFAAPVSFVSGAQPKLVDVGDLDGDGKPDIAVCNNLSGTISVFKNISAVGIIDQTSFATKSDFSFNPSPYGVAIADLDGDGVPEIAVANTGTGTISLFMPAVNHAAPAITRFIPDTAGRGQTVKISGAHFSAASKVLFGDSAARSFTISGDTLITAIVGGGTSGKIHIATSAGEDSLGLFTFIDSPSLFSFQPLMAGEGDTILIKGKYLFLTNALSLGGVPAASYKVLSDTSIQAVVGTGSSGSVLITTPYGTSSIPGFIFVQPPVINYFTPTFGDIGDTIYVHGKYLLTTQTVSLGGTPAAAFRAISDTLLLVKIGTGSTGSILIDNIGDTVSAPGFSFVSKLPHLTSFSPVKADSSITVTIKGTQLTSTTVVKFGGIVAASFVVLSDSVITARPGTGSNGYVYVLTAFGKDSLPGFLYDSIPGLTPHVFSFSPLSGSRDSLITIKGQHFTTANAVSFGGTPAKNFIIQSDSVIKAVVGNGSTGFVMVRTTASLKDSLPGFTYMPPVIILPYISSFSPTTGYTDTVVTIKGTHLDSVTGISFGGTPAKSFIKQSDSVIKAVVGAGSTGYVTISNGTYKDSLPGFTFAKPPPITPDIISFSPSSGFKDSVITIKGKHMDSVTIVTFGGTPAKSFIIQSDSVITAVVGAGSTGYVAVKNLLYSDSVAGFTYVVAPPITPDIISFSPATGSTDSVITIKGKHMDSVTIVTFGGTAAKSFSIKSDSVITAVVGAGSSGFVAVKNLNYSDSVSGFTFIDPTQPAPVIKSFTPDTGKTGTVVIIKGSDFTNTSSVSFGGVPAESFNVQSDSVISAVVGTGATGNVQVTTGSGTASAPGFYFILPVIDSTFSFIDFVGRDTAGHVSLLWATRNDIVVASYTVERGKDTLVFSSVTTLPSHQLPGFQYYFYDDAQPLTGLSYYRIKYTDTLGNVFYSKIIPISSLTSTILIYPNPATNYIMVTTPYSPYPSVIRLLDGMGKTVRTVQVAAGVLQTRVDLTGILPNVYTVSWTDGAVNKWMIRIARQLWIQ